MTKRKSDGGGIRRKITPQAIAAWQAGDWLGVYRELDCRPWHPHPFDVREEDTPPPTDEWNREYPRIVELRRQMIDLAGEPPTTKENA